MHINNAVFIISGASAGIGAALAQQLAAQGAYLVLIARRAEALAQLNAQLVNAQMHRIVIGDIGNRSTIDEAIQIAREAFGHIDCIICNAGVGLSAPVASIDIADFQACIDTNVYGVLHMIQATLPVFQQQQYGKIVVISSVVGVQGLPYSGGYCATKGAIERLCDALRVELIGTSITINVVRPGTVNSDFSSQRHGQHHERRAAHIQGISPTSAAQRIINGIIKNKRYVYTRWQDRFILWGSQFVAPLADRVLARAISWRE